MHTEAQLHNHDNMRTEIHTLVYKQVSNHGSLSVDWKVWGL